MKRRARINLVVFPLSLILGAVLVLEGIRYGLGSGALPKFSFLLLFVGICVPPLVIRPLAKRRTEKDLRDMAELDSLKGLRKD